MERSFLRCKLWSNHILQGERGAFKSQKHFWIPVQPWFLTFINKRQQSKSPFRRVHTPWRSPTLPGKSTVLRLISEEKKKSSKYRGWGNSTSKLITVKQWPPPPPQPHPAPPNARSGLYSPSSLCIDSQWFMFTSARSLLPEPEL